jgi:hypothetical protein
MSHTLSVVCAAVTVTSLSLCTGAGPSPTTNQASNSTPTHITPRATISKHYHDGLLRAADDCSIYATDAEAVDNTVEQLVEQGDVMVVDAVFVDDYIAEVTFETLSGCGEHRFVMCLADEGDDAQRLVLYQDTNNTCTDVESVTLSLDMSVVADEIDAGLVDFYFDDPWMSVE